MIRGNLQLLTLKALDKKPLSGYALMKFLEEKLGTKPSPGSMYPLLDILAKNKLVTCKEDGRKKVYSLTSKGRKKLSELDSQNDVLIQQMEKAIKNLKKL